MKTIGLIGGMSWESSLEYYRLLNQLVKEELGGSHSARSILYSLDFAPIEEMQTQGDWQGLAREMVTVAEQIERAGADLLLICSNTMHILAEEVESHVEIPLLHIAAATAARIREQGLEKVGLLGTRFTMEKDFYRGRLRKKYGIEVVIPQEQQRELVHNIIYQELILGNTKEESREEYRQVIADLVDRGAEGIVLGCTEIPLLIREEDSPVPIFNTTRIHAEEAVKLAL